MPVMAVAGVIAIAIYFMVWDEVLDQPIMMTGWIAAHAGTVGIILTVEDANIRFEGFAWILDIGASAVLTLAIFVVLMVVAYIALAVLGGIVSIKRTKPETYEPIDPYAHLNHTQWKAAKAAEAAESAGLRSRIAEYAAEKRANA